MAATSRWFNKARDWSDWRKPDSTTMHTGSTQECRSLKQTRNAGHPPKWQEDNTPAKPSPGKSRLAARLAFQLGSWRDLQEDHESDQDPSDADDEEGTDEEEKETLDGTADRNLREQSARDREGRDSTGALEPSGSLPSRARERRETTLTSGMDGMDFGPPLEEHQATQGQAPRNRANETSNCGGEVSGGEMGEKKEKEEVEENVAEVEESQHLRKGTADLTSCTGEGSSTEGLSSKLPKQEAGLQGGLQDASSSQSRLYGRDLLLSHWPGPCRFEKLRHREDSQTTIRRAVNTLFNKVSHENLDSSFLTFERDIKDLNPEELVYLASQVFQRVVKHPQPGHRHGDPYANVIYGLHNRYEGFAYLLLKLCKGMIDKLFRSSPPVLLSKEEELKIRNHNSANIKLIGHCFLGNLLSLRPLLQLADALLERPSDDRLQFALELLALVGPRLEMQAKGEAMKRWELLEKIKSSRSARLKCLVQNVLDKKDNGWPEKHDVKEKPKELDAAQLAANDAVMTALASTESIVGSSETNDISTQHNNKSAHPSISVSSVSKTSPKLEAGDLRHDVGHTLSTLMRGRSSDSTSSPMHKAAESEPMFRSFSDCCSKFRITTKKYSEICGSSTPNATPSSTKAIAAPPAPSVQPPAPVASVDATVAAGQSCQGLQDKPPVPRQQPALGRRPQLDSPMAQTRTPSSSSTAGKARDVSDSGGCRSTPQQRCKGASSSLPLRVRPPGGVGVSPPSPTPSLDDWPRNSAFRKRPFTGESWSAVGPLPSPTSAYDPRLTMQGLKPPGFLPHSRVIAAGNTGSNAAEEDQAEDDLTAAGFQPLPWRNSGHPNVSSSYYYQAPRSQDDWCHLGFNTDINVNVDPTTVAPHFVTEVTSHEQFSWASVPGGILVQLSTDLPPGQPSAWWSSASRLGPWWEEGLTSDQQTVQAVCVGQGIQRALDRIIPWTDLVHVVGEFVRPQNLAQVVGLYPTASNFLSMMLARLFVERSHNGIFDTHVLQVLPKAKDIEESTRDCTWNLLMMTLWWIGYFKDHEVARRAFARQELSGPLRKAGRGRDPQRQISRRECQYCLKEWGIVPS
mmetsp:Transcript_72733/g.151868  ORF Transcript_72733/g.151868 Transcript_72733/m.151868 type:complete len:1081 (-) Transcript_72733:475-3717(-)|eukprot:CAMPEP_0206498896 /NCGR_PEP_ID=MMETSP0324_2-20121206/51340_1 /ASSEMBLY_ACC=CAM_ASM_000836 /TAXON_ID=2866 /ORGANISM="Crypthecodinium cohnii, Strain Seligo" /LENGTH=1080 /DNA_ID=CAMNT_0053985317 /DNA_START=123 /DNA_END=3365 /DNA_ORIENTATION=-